MLNSTNSNDEVELVPREEERSSALRRVTKSLKIIAKNQCGINAEPFMFLCAIVYGIILSVTPIYLFWARCVQIFGGFDDLKNATKFCSRISVQNESSALDIVESDISKMSVYIQLCSTFTSLVSSPLIGVWSDYHGRRKPLLLVSITFTLYIAIQLLAIFIYDRVNIYYLMFADEFMMGCFGGVATPAVITSAIIIDDSRKDLVFSGIPWRVTLACVGRTVGNILGSWIYMLCAVPIAESAERHVDGIVLTFGVALACCVVALIFVAFCVHETHNVIDLSENSRGLAENFRHYTLDTFCVFTQAREDWTRLCLCLVTGFMFVDFINLDNSLQYLIFKRSPFRWSDELFDRYLILKNILTAVGVTVLPLVLNLLSFAGKESILLIVAIAANTANTFTISVAQSTELIFIAAPLFLMGSGTIPGFQTVLSKMVAKEETARMFALFSMLLVVCPLFSKAVLYSIYDWTFASYPGFVFLLEAVLLFFTLIGQIIVHCLMRERWAADEAAAHDAAPLNDVE